MKNVSSLDNQSGHVGHVPFLAKVGGVGDERTYFSSAIGPKGRSDYVRKGVGFLLLPFILAFGASVIGYFTLNLAGTIFGPLFFLANSSVQSMMNPIISEKRAVHLSPWPYALVALAVILVNGAFAATLFAGLLFKPTVDQRHMDNVVNVMASSQEKRNLMVSEEALEKERTNLLNKQQVNTSAIDQASKTYSSAQQTLAQASASLDVEITKGSGGRKAGVGKAAEELRKAKQEAIANEAKAKIALEEARNSASANISIPENLVLAYNSAKEKYETKEKSLIEAGPGLLKTFQWLFGMLHTEPLLIVYVLGWTFLEALGIISLASHRGSTSYERARYATIQEDIALQREAANVLNNRAKVSTEYRAAVKADKKEAKILRLEVKDPDQS